MNTLIENIKNQLSLPLPGIDAQYKMAHAIRRQPPTIPEDARVACTMALLYPKNEDLHIVLIQRTSNNPNDRHGGQISFPGGGAEETDDSLAATAIREAHEEVGVDPQLVNVLGALTGVYIPVSNFNVYPFVGFSDTRPSFTPQESEVHAILEVPLSVLMDEKTRSITNIPISKRMTLQNVPYYDIEGHVVWGATAMMLSEFLEVVQSAQNGMS